MMKLTHEIIIKTKSNLNYPSELFINGKYQKSISEKSFDNISPIDGSIINKVFLAQQEDVNLAVNLNIYPNPTKGIFNISFVSDEVNSFKLTILDAFGKLIEMENKEMFVGEYTKQVDLSEYPRGIYMVQIKTNNSFITKRVVVQ